MGCFLYSKQQMEGRPGLALWHNLETHKEAVAKSTPSKLKARKQHLPLVTNR